MNRVVEFTDKKSLKDLRNSLGITQKELGDFFGVSDRTIYQMEKDSSNIKDSLLKKYIIAFNTSYDHIFLGTEYDIFVFERKRKKDFTDELLKLDQIKQEG